MCKGRYEYNKITGTKKTQSVVSLSFNDFDGEFSCYGAQIMQEEYQKRLFKIYLIIEILEAMWPDTWEACPVCS